MHSIILETLIFKVSFYVHSIEGIFIYMKNITNIRKTLK